MAWWDNGIFSHLSQKNDLKTSELQNKVDYNLIGFIALSLSKASIDRPR